MQNGQNIKHYATPFFMLLTTVLWMTFEAWLWGLIPALLFGFLLFGETKERRRLYLALSAGIAILIVAPIKSDITLSSYLTVAPFYLLSLVLPRLILWDYDKTILKIRIFPEVWRRADILHVCIALPLSVIGLCWYLLYANPEVVQNWNINTATPIFSLTMLAIGMYLVGFWDEVFSQNTALAIYEKLFNFPFANVLASSIYAAALWDLAFRGYGFFVLCLFTFSQGLFWHRSRALFWAILVHFSIEALLFYLIARAHF